MRFDTAALPERERFGAFGERFSRFIATEIIKRDEMPFEASLSFWRGNALTLATLGTSAAGFLRTSRYMSDGDDSLSVIFCEFGGYHATQLGQSNMLEPGEGILFHHGRLGALHALKHSQRCSIKLPRDRLLKLAPHAERAVGHKLPRHSPALGLLFHYLQGAQTAELTPGEPVTHLFEEHVLHLAAHLLGAGAGARELVENGGLRQARLRAIMYEIETGYGKPELSAVAVAGQLGVTPRYVHRLLEETGKTFSEWLLQRRLAAAMEILHDGRENGRKIVDIAFEAGFADISHFNRSFRRHFGDTPSGARRLPRRGGG